MMRCVITALFALLVTAAVYAPVAAATSDNEGPRTARLLHRSLPAVFAAPSSIDFKRDYSDPASDVTLLNASTNKPILVNGSYVLGGEPKDINIKWVRSKEAKNNTTVEVSVEVVGGGEIANLANTTYTMNMYTNVTNKSHYFVEYTNGKATLRNNATGETADLSANTTISGPNPNKQGILTVAVGKSLMKNVTSWNIDATARQVGSPYSYQDFGWEVPGNPGSTPNPPPPPAPTPFYQPWLPYIITAFLLLAVIAVLVLLSRKKKRGTVPATR